MIRVTSRIFLIVVVLTAFAERADASRDNMGLTSWKGAVVRKGDVTIAKNYLDEDELAALNNLVEQYLLFAEGQAMRRIPMHMADWAGRLDAFLELNQRDILDHVGRISHEMAKERAEGEYERFNRQRIAASDKALSDFDQAAKAIEKRNDKGGKRKEE